MGAVLLKADDVSVSYAAVRVLKSVSLEVREGQIVGLIGANGAGKTTFIDAMSGLTSASGSMTLNGQSLVRTPPAQRARMGLGRTFQNDRLFDDLTVLANILAGRPGHKWWWPFRDLLTSAERRDAKALRNGWCGEVLGLEPDFDRYPNELSLGRRRIVGLGRAAIREPVVALLDEPGAGLDSAETEVLARQLLGLRDQGIALLLVDHDMSLVLSVCDYLYVLDFGEIIAQGDPEEVCREPRVIKAYLGHSANAGPSL